MVKVKWLVTYLKVYKLKKDEMGFEPMMPNIDMPDFKSGTLNRSVIHPVKQRACCEVRGPPQFYFFK